VARDVPVQAASHDFDDYTDAELNLREPLFDFGKPELLLTLRVAFLQNVEQTASNLVALDGVRKARMSSTKQRATAGGSSIGLKGMGRI